ncbi:MAG TPA: ATP-binding protein, partial [Rhodocyclaceae bacterium]|nr:ATP-binding protein [Rhodocyclaceae bacterium]
TIRLPVPHLAGARAPTPPGRMLAALAALIAGIGLLAWIAVRVATRPLSRLADAARALGEDPNRAALETGGPVEVALAASAFNQMQQRIREHVGERTRILAAISHDLQTPITRLRLRAEQIEDETLRVRVQSDLDAMQALAKEGLDYARSLDAAAPLQAVDLDALVDALCEDARDMGWQVDRSGHIAHPCRAQVVALRRALWNLIENGVKFGGRVEVTLAETAGTATLQVRDHGAGLPAAELERVFEPFYRTESSRNRETGGTGLGLAIARNLLRAQGGEVSLENAADGGLIATVRLPAHAAD